MASLHWSAGRLTRRSLSRPLQALVAPLSRNSGDVTNVDFSVVPPNFDGGLHNAPRNQWVMVTSGLAYITVPGDDSDGVYIQRGESGLIFAAGTPSLSEGHYTSYLSIMETIALLFPTKDGAVPAHRVVRPGPCLVSETAGFRALVGMN
ncbi:hypothetical protein PG987_015795 [Apiospora arundinis]